MKLLLTLVILFSPITHAGWFGDWCSRWLVADDPAPYAEVDTDQLLFMYNIHRTGQQLDELLYRYRAQMMNHRQAMEFRGMLRGDKGN